MSDQHAGLRAGMHGPAPLSARLTYTRRNAG